MASPALGAPTQHAQAPPLRAPVVFTRGSEQVAATEVELGFLGRFLRESPERPPQAHSMAGIALPDAVVAADVQMGNMMRVMFESLGGPSQAQTMADVAIEAGLDAYVEALLVYVHRCLTPPRVSCSMFALQQPNWRASFKQWNIIYVQAVAVAKLVSVVLWVSFRIWQSDTSGAIISSVTNVFLYPVILIYSALFGHLAWGFAWASMFDVTGAFADSRKVFIVIGFAYLFHSVFFAILCKLKLFIGLALALPTFYLLLACQRLAGGAAARELGGMAGN